ncbi:Hypp2982 [Branchiostoma lanceolatum]|uniref:Hypp2982 protein n=1 Tax=Branchiostoma lanceolatum TaxID=7740 RepID=A0A8K0ESI2_BRALA|nr:Hypp2982 [Branchiostoma lanceolatum]
MYGDVCANLGGSETGSTARVSVSDSWVPAAAGAAATAAVVIIAIATAMYLRRAKRKSGLKDVEGQS